MLIVHVVRQFHPCIGGLEGVVLELATAQIASGHAVRVLTLNRVFNDSEGKVLPDRDRIRGIEVVRVPFFGPCRYPIALAAIKHIGDADIVHVHGIDFFADYLAWTKPLHHKKLVVSTHGGYFHTPFAARLKQFYFSTVTRLTLTWYPGVAAVSATDYELFSTIRPRGMVCVENGVDIFRYFGAASPTPVKSILAIGRFATHKRLDLVMLFVAALRRRDSHWTLRVAGRPWDLTASDVISLAAEAGIREALELITLPSEAEVRKLMAGCSVIATASEYEGFGLTAVEGMSAGLIPLLSDIPSFRRLFDQSRIGMILDFNNAESASARFVEKWTDFETNYAAYRKSLMSVSGKYEWSHVSGKYQGLYEAVLGTKTRSILDVPIQVATFSKAVETLDSRFSAGDPTIVAFANAHTLNVASVDARFRAVLQKSIVFNDGIGVNIASSLLFGAPFPENLDGTDFTPAYLANTENRYRIFLLGARPGVAERAARRLLQCCSKHAIVGWRDGYFADGDAAEIIECIRASRTDILLVAMGNPRQELWLMDNLPATGCRLGLGVGALFDFLAGEVPRAPAWIRSARLEWAYRLCREPHRLWRRYLIGNAIFIVRVVGQWWSGARVLTRAIREDPVNTEHVVNATRHFGQKHRKRYQQTRAYWVRQG
jgi:alpha-1,3-mannosyltransferase